MKLMVVQLALALLQFGHVDEARDWEFRAGRFEVVGKALSRELNIPVTVHEQLRDEVVIGIFKNKTQDEMIAGFSDSTLTRWTFENGGLTIRPDGRRREEIEKKRILAKSQRIRESLEKVLGRPYSKEQLRKDMSEALALSKKMTEDDEYDYEKVSEFEDKSPSRRLVCEFLQSLKIEDLAKSKSETRLVYRKNPTRFQYPLGAMHSRLVDSANSYLKDLKEVSPESPVDEDGMYYAFSLLQQFYTDSPITDVEAEIDVSDYGYSVNVSFLADEVGVVFQGSTFIQMVEYSEESEAKRSLFSKFESEFDFHPDDALFLKVMQGMYQPNTNVSDEDRKAVMKLLASFYSDEPLSRTASNMLVALSREAQKDVCGFVRDLLLLPYSANGETKLKTSELLEQVATENEPTIIEESGRFLLTKPIIENGFDGFDRRVISSMASSYLKDNTLTFEALAEAAKLSPSKNAFVLAHQVLSSVLYGSSVGYDSYDYESSTITEAYTSMKLYASLGASDKSKLRSGVVRVPANGLGKSGVDELLKFLLRREDSLRAIDQKWETEEQSVRAQQILEEMKQAIGTYDAEPTFVLAQAASSPVVLEFSIGNVVKLSGSKGGDFGQVNGSIDTLAREAVMSEIALAQGQGSEYYRPFQSYSSYGADRLKIDVFVGKFWKTTLQCEVPTTQETRYESIGSLPKEIRDEYERAVAKYREEYKGISFGGNRKKVIPPN